jgi:micrococcal nuclease
MFQEGDVMARSMRPVVGIALFSLLSLLPPLAAGSAPAGEAAPAPALPAKDFRAGTAHRVVRVVDGDTVVLSIDGKDTTVRLIGVNTPETVDPRRPVQAYGKEASEFTKNLLKGESVYIEGDAGPSEADRYGRKLAYLYRAPDGLFVNLEIVRQGYGQAYTRFPFKYMDLFRHYERAARESGKGLWRPEAGATATGPAVKAGDGSPGAAKAAPEVRSVQPAAKASGSTAKAAEKTESAKGSTSAPVASRETTVYITASGSKYHRSGCVHLGASRTAIPLSRAAGKYEPCADCRPPRP